VYTIALALSGDNRQSESCVIFVAQRQFFTKARPGGATPSSTLSHHLDKLKAEDLVHVERESTFLHYTANTAALQELLQFLYTECCTRNQADKPERVIQICK
jgi:hypothetical protein